MNIQTDRALIPADRPAARYLTVSITAPDPGRRTERPAVNVALVLDRSGSMAGRKFDMARQAMDRAIRLLDERDRLALVCYDDEIDTLLGSTTASAEARTNALARLREIDPRGGTDLCGGWLRGAEEVARGADAARAREAAGGTARDDAGATASAAGDVVTRVLLLSDGLANAGETNPDTLAAKAAALRDRGIATSTFGLGADFDETLMSSLATEGGGHFYFIEQPAQIADFLQSELGDALDVVARDARLIVSVTPGRDGRPGGGRTTGSSARPGSADGPDSKDAVQVGVVNDVPSESHGNDLHVRLGDLVAGQEVSLVLVVACESHLEGATASVSLRLADRDAKLFPHPLRVDWRAVDEAADAVQPVNTGVIVTAATQIANRARRQALDHNRRGDYAGAAEQVKAAAAAVRAMAAEIAPLAAAPEGTPYAAAAEVARAVKMLEAIAADLEHDDELALPMPSMARKARHFAAYSVSRGRDTFGRARKAGS